MSLEDALEKARAELEQLKAKEAELLESSGMREVIAQLTAENQNLSEDRQTQRERLEAAEKDLASAREQKAMLELQIKGARSRVQKLSAAVGTRR